MGQAQFWNFSIEEDINGIAVSSGICINSISGKSVRYFINIVLICVFPAIVQADCMSKYISVYPTTKELKTDGLILIEGFGMSQKVIESLGSKYPVFLKSGNEKVELEIIKTEC